MADQLETKVPAATAPLPVAGSIEAHVAEVREWLLGTIESGKSKPGLIAMVTELYEEAKTRRERRESFARAIASGGALAIFGLTATWIKDHWR